VFDVLSGTTEPAGRLVRVISAPSPVPEAGARGVVRLLNTAGGRVLNLAGNVDAEAVDVFQRRYGLEPARIDAIDAGSVTSLSAPALELLLDHLAAAGRAGRPVELRPARRVEQLLGSGGAGNSS
jgi:hypothetical protein